jgi:hypothetical protein
MDVRTFKAVGQVAGTGGLALVFLGLLLWPANAAEQTAGNCSPIVRDTQGNVQVNINCSIQLTAIQLKQLIDEVRRPTPIPSEILDRLTNLSAELGVTKGAMARFLATLGERDVPEQDLDAKLRQIAAQRLTLVKQLQEVSGDD